MSGDVLLLDTKSRTQQLTLPHSKTFDFDRATNPRGPQQLNAVQRQVLDVLRDAQMPTHVKDPALPKVDAYSCSTITVGAGNVRNNSFVRFCGGKRC